MYQNIPIGLLIWFIQKCDWLYCGPRNPSRHIQGVQIEMQNLKQMLSGQLLKCLGSMIWISKFMVGINTRKAAMNLRSFLPTFKSHSSNRWSNGILSQTLQPSVGTRCFAKLSWTDDNLRMQPQSLAVQNALKKIEKDGPSRVTWRCGWKKAHFFERMLKSTPGKKITKPEHGSFWMGFSFV